MAGALWLGAVPAAAEAPIEFSAEEQAYIARAGTISMCVDPDWVPFERIDEQGRHEGIAADLVQLVARRVGLKIELYPVANWDESLVASKAGRCQIMSFLNQTPAREQWLSFTAPIFLDPNVIITREEHAYIGDLKGLSDQSVALPRGTMVEERIRRDFPNLRVITTGSEQEAIALVSERKADMTVRSLIVAAYTIRKEGLFNLKIAGQIIDYTNQLRIGVLKDETILRDILDKGVRTITPQEREAISNRHVAIQVRHGVDYGLFWKVVVGGALIFLVVVYWNRKLRVLNKELARLSVTDRLTGIYNRVKLDEAFAQEIQRAARFGQPFGIILLDIDHFKRVNDVHGHPAGDRVLIEVAATLRANTRETDIVGRWGGEEFLVICPHTDTHGLARLAENLRQRLQGLVFPAVGSISASFGAAGFQAGDESKDVVARADAALYEAKRNGRNRVELR
jgi:diguanylate cyclase (GGDEF)-like protein